MDEVFFAAGETALPRQSSEGGRSHWRKPVVLHKKEYIRKFFENINTTKLKKEKMPYLKNWLALS